MDLKKILNFTLILLLLQTVYSTEEAQTTEQAPEQETGDSPQEKAEKEQTGSDVDLNETDISVGELNQLHLQDCNTKLMNSLGFKSQKRGLEMELAMCPGLTHSCCVVEDQLTMYEMWVAAKGKEHLENKFKIQTEVIGKIFF